MREKNTSILQMKSRNSIAIRAAGQRSIKSTFLFQPVHKCSSRDKNESKVPVEISENPSKNISLSAFLNHKLHSNSVLPVDKENNTLTSSEVKKEKFLSSVGQDRSNKSIFQDDHYGCDEPRDKQRPVIEESVFKLFNGTQEGKVRNCSSEGLAARSDGDLKKQGQNHLVVLGDEPKPKRRVCARMTCSNKKPKPLYNHYENGTGWWDSEREGVDNNEVGAEEVWEGMGSTTLGGLDWH